MTTLTRVDPADLRHAVEAVPDPELPPVTVGMLGMIHRIDVDPDGRATVELLPTFSGCPATDVIREDVEVAARAVPGVTDVVVRFRFDPSWSATRITAEGHDALREFGITPPGGVVSSPALEGLDQRTVLPLRVEEPRRICPYCGSGDTETDSAFGPTPCRSIHYCRACRQPFEAFKDL